MATTVERSPIGDVGGPPGHAPAAPPPSRRTRWPYAGAGQKPLLMAALLMVVGSMLPWVMTPVGNLLGVAGAGVLTLYLAVIGIAGALIRRRLPALIQATVTGAGAIALTTWQLGRLAQLSAATDTWGQLVPGVGLIMVLASGLLALVAAHRLYVQR